jgi:hypothetical protein
MLQLLKHQVQRTSQQSAQPERGRVQVLEQQLQAVLATLQQQEQHG